MKSREYSLEVGGRILKAQFSDLADQANGSVIMSYGNTILLVTACMSKKPKDGDYFPLGVEYEERFYAAGKILGGQYNKREGRPSDEAILSGRVVDRTIRPLFEQYIRHEIQVVITVLSIDKDDPDIVAIIGASLALATSDIPWGGPVSAVRIGKITKENSSDFQVNPTYDDRAHTDSSLDMIACGQGGKINMIEVGAKEISNEVAHEALKKASEEIEKIQEWQKNIISEMGKAKKVIDSPVSPEGMKELFAEKIAPKFLKEIFIGVSGKGHIGAVMEEWLGYYREKYPDEILAKKTFAMEYFEEMLNDLVHKEAIENNKRPDGRKPDEIRQLFAKAGGVSPIIHGTGIFYR